MDVILKWALAGEILILLGLIGALVLSVISDKKAAAQTPERKEAAPPVQQKAAPPVHKPVAHTGPEACLLQGMARHATRFTGLYEAMYMAAVGSDLQVPDAYREWQVRMERLKEDREFYEAFCRSFPADCAAIGDVRRLLECAAAAGIRRDKAATCVADGNTLKRYIYLGGDALCPGNTYTVAKPCWLLGDTVVEQGVLMPGR